MFLLICAVVVVLLGLGFKRLLPAGRQHRQQVRFIRETLAANRTFDNRRIIASLSTVPDRINNLRPTIRSLLKQTRPPDEIVLAIPEFSIRASEPRQPRPAAVIRGCGTYFIQPRFFDESLWDYSQAPQGAVYMDEIWISRCLAKRNVKRYVVPASAMMRSVFRQRRTLSLHDVPEGRQFNNNETIAIFGDAWDVFASH